MICTARNLTVKMVKEGRGPMMYISLMVSIIRFIVVLYDNCNDANLHLLGYKKPCPDMTGKL